MYIHTNQHCDFLFCYLHFIYYIYVHTPTHTHTHTYIYIYIYDSFFALEFIFFTLFKPGYCGSFFFYLDFVSTISLVPDFLLLWHIQVTYVMYVTLMRLSHVTLICGTWLVFMCYMTVAWLICMWYDSFTCVTWLIYMCGTTNLHVWHDSFTCATRFIYTSIMSTVALIDCLLLRRMQAFVNQCVASVCCTTLHCFDSMWIPSAAADLGIYHLFRHLASIMHV